eukprot:5565078-Pleurochrysis_carterae.AAC.1
MMRSDRCRIMFASVFTHCWFRARRSCSLTSMMLIGVGGSGGENAAAELFEACSKTPACTGRRAGACGAVSAARGKQSLSNNSCCCCWRCCWWLLVVLLVVLSS